MGCCSVANCSNHSRNGFRMFRFPIDEERRKKWTINCRRMNWQPSSQAQICNVHFEESQYESNSKGKKMLKRNAIPTIIDVRNPPPSVTDKRKKGIGLPKPCSLLYNKAHNEKTAASDPALLKRIEALEKENEMLKEQVSLRNSKLSSFLSEEQIESLSANRPVSWSEESIIKGLKMRFAVGKHGYNYLRSIGYPSPGYSTLNKRIQNVKINFGTFPLYKNKYRE